MTDDTTATPDDRFSALLREAAAGPAPSPEIRRPSLFTWGSWMRAILGERIPKAPVLAVLLLLVASGGDTVADWSVDATVIGSGSSFWKAGDVNADGYDDVIIGSSQGDTGPGRAFVFQGGPDGLPAQPHWTVAGETIGDAFGYTVSRAGDVDGDGIADVIVGAPNAAESRGRVYVYRGGRGGLSPTWSWTAQGNGGGGYASWSIMTAGDVDGDGRDEVIVGDMNAGSTGHVYVYKAQEGRSTLTLAWDTDGSPGAALPVSSLGCSVSTAGDVNGDGFADVIVGAAGSGYNGRAAIHLGSPTGLSPTPSWVVVKSHYFNQYGTSVAAAGDVDVDGFDDVLVGDPYNGTVYLNRGSAGPMSTSDSWSVYRPQAGYLGTSVASAGDFNGDGYRDIAVGTTGYQAWIYIGSSSGFSQEPAFKINRGGIAEWVWAMEAGDVNGDGGSDLLVAGDGATCRAEIFLGKGILSDLAQSKLDGATPIADGGFTLEPGVVLSGMIERTNGGMLEVEVKEVGEAFTGVPLYSSQAIDHEGRVSVSVPLDLDHSWHWRARVSGTGDRWFSHGSRLENAAETDFRTRSNAAPSGSSPGQFLATSGIPVAAGGGIDDRDLLEFRVLAADSHQDDLVLEVEVRLISEDFSNVATHSSPMTAVGAATATATLALGEFHWQWRLIDSWGEAGSWSPFAANSESSADLVVLSRGSNGTACAARDGGSPVAWLALLLTAVMAAIGRRRMGTRPAAIALLTIAGLGISEAVVVRGAALDVDPSGNLAMMTCSNQVDVCWNAADDEFLVVWQDWDSVDGSTSGVTARRVVGSNGIPSGDPVAILPKAGIEVRDVAVAHDPVSKRYLVAWSWQVPGTSNVVVDARAMAADGTLLPVTRVGGNESDGRYYANHQDVAFDGTNFLVVWEQGSPVTRADIMGRRYSPAGDAVGPAFTIEGSSNDSDDPSVAFLAGAGACLVAYAESATGSESRTIRARVVMPDQDVRPAQTLSSSTGNHDWPRVAANETDKEWMTVWERNDIVNSWAGLDPGDGSNNSYAAAIEFRRVKWTAASPVVQGPEAGLIQTAWAVSVAPAVAWSALDDEYVVAWQREPLGRSTDMFSTGSDILSARIKGASDEVIIDSETPLAVTDTAQEWAPVLAAAPGTREVFAAWPGMTDVDIFVRGILVSTSVPADPPPPTPPSPEVTIDSGSGGGGCGLAGSAGSEMGLALLIAGLVLSRRR